METLIILGVLALLMFFMFRSNKKQERETNLMRSNLEVGDEITTIGGIIGEIVKIKEETVTIETGKDRTKIRILRSAVRTVDVHAYEKRGEVKKPENAQAADGKQNSLPGNKSKVKNMNGNESNAADAPNAKKKKKKTAPATEKAVEEQPKEELAVTTEAVNDTVEVAQEEKAE